MPTAFQKTAILAGIGRLAATYASMPVWTGSRKTDAGVLRIQMTRLQRVQLWDAARAFDRQTHQPGRHGGAIGHNALKILHTLLFDFLNIKSGRLDPSYDAIAKKANCARTSVYNAIHRLKRLGVLSWVRRCSDNYHDGRYVLKQDTNAYAILPPAHWHGFIPEPFNSTTPPPPERGTWGDPHPTRNGRDQYLVDRTNAMTIASSIDTLKRESDDPIDIALARLGSFIVAKEQRS